MLRTFTGSYAPERLPLRKSASISISIGLTIITFNSHAQIIGNLCIVVYFITHYPSQLGELCTQLYTFNTLFSIVLY